MYLKNNAQQVHYWGKWAKWGEVIFYTLYGTQIIHFIAQLIVSWQLRQLHRHGEPVCQTGQCKPGSKCDMCQIIMNALSERMLEIRKFFIAILVITAFRFTTNTSTVIYSNLVDT